VYVPLAASINRKHLKLKSEADRRKTYETWSVPFMDANQLAAAGFYFTNLSDVVRCVFCGVRVCHWSAGDDALKEHHRWSPSFGFAKGLCFGKIPILPNEQPVSQVLTRSLYVCGPHLELRLNSLPERSMYSFLHAFFVTFVSFITPH